MLAKCSEGDGGGRSLQPKMTLCVLQETLIGHGYNEVLNFHYFNLFYD